MLVLREGRGPVEEEPAGAEVGPILRVGGECDTLNAPTLWLLVVVGSVGGSLCLAFTASGRNT